MFALINALAMCFEVKYGMGRHVENVRLEESMEQLKVCVLCAPRAAGAS